MEIKDIAEKIAGFAPTIASLMGSPMAGMAIKLVSGALGISSGSVDDIFNAIGSGDPDIQVKLAALEDDLKKYAESISEQDTDSARQMQLDEEKMGIKSRMPIIVTIFLMATFSGTLLLLFLPIATNLQNSTLVGSMVGMLTREFIQACRFYIGGDGEAS